MDYDIKKGHFENVDGDGLKNIVNEAFGNAKNEGDLIVASFGALEKLETKVQSKSVLFVSTKMRTDVSPEVGAETIKRYNQFLEKATGMNSKERGKRMQKKAKDGKL
ncbi:MAG: hypothetical protein A4E32_01929 [Methanomassiliicoccales archaeon PtaU1.Bin124]|nr:MAG: hypothetical protein A4E32_01929 [Methanomassiliicoccales archaeon PtaU1.Bin124]